MGYGDPKAPLQLPDVQRLKDLAPKRDPWDALGQGVVSFGQAFGQSMLQARQEAAKAKDDRIKHQDALTRMAQAQQHGIQTLREQERLRRTRGLSPGQMIEVTGEIPPTTPGGDPSLTLAGKASERAGEKQTKGLEAAAANIKNQRVDRALAFLTAELIGYSGLKDKAVIEFLNPYINKQLGKMRAGIDAIYQDPGITEVAAKRELTALIGKSKTEEGKSAVKVGMRNAGIEARRAYEAKREQGLKDKERIIRLTNSLKAGVNEGKAAFKKREGDLKKMAEARGGMAKDYSNAMNGSIAASKKGEGALNLMGASPLNESWTGFLKVGAPNARLFINALRSWADNPWWYTHENGSPQTTITQPSQLLNAALSGYAREGANSPLQPQARKELRELARIFNQTHASYYGPVSEDQLNPSHPEYLAILNEKIHMANQFFNQSMPFLEKEAKAAYNPEFYTQPAEALAGYDGSVYQVVGKGRGKKEKQVWGREKLLKFIKKVVP